MNRSADQCIGRKPGVRWLRFLLMLSLTAQLLTGCAFLRRHEPLSVSVAGIESLPAQSLEVRMQVRLRVQNPNDDPIDYDGVSLKLDVQGKTYASGVSGERGTIPRFGEAVIEVPVTISTLRLALQAFGEVRDGKGPEKLKYKLKGRLAGTAYGSMNFSTEGELDLATAGP